MLVLLLKSTACLTAFLAFYKLVLERESIHHFKRFYLVAAIIASFLIPNMVFTEYIEALPSTEMENIPILTDLPTTQAPQNAVQEENFSWGPVLWSIYGLGVLGFGFRFIGHLAQIWSRIRKNPKHKDNFITRVLLKQPMPPHTFFRFIFLNQKQFENKSIPQEVLLHEETHAKQKHSLDILFIELLQVVLWFNPLIYLFKSSIKLNHEFLADSAVIQKNNDHSHYQNTILSYLSHDGHITHQSTGIANAITYSSIKKRFTVMKTKTTKKSFVLKSFLLLPLTALLLFGFSETRQIEKDVTIDQIIQMDLNADGSVRIENKMVQYEEIAQTLKQDYLRTINAEETKVEINVEHPVHLNFLNNIAAEIRTTGIDLIKIMAAEVIMEEGQYSDHIPLTPSTTILKADRMTIVENTAARSDMAIYNQLAKKYNAVPVEERIIPLKDLKLLENIYKKMDEAEKSKAQPFPECLPKNIGQKTVNPIEIHINNKSNLLFQNKSILLEDLEDELSKINNHLSFEQRKKVIRSIVQVEAKTSKKVISKVDKILTEYGTATINVLGPKQANQQSASREEMKEYNTLAKKYNAMDRNNMTIKKKDVMRLKEIYEKMSQKQRDDAEPFPDFPAPPPAPKSPKAPKATKPVNEANPKNLPVPPTPPAPPKPIEHVKEMAEKGASFTYNGKAITAKEAVEVVQKNQHINIDAREAHGARPVVKLSTDPIVIDN
ncbi:M56 family metallopeptidase [Allomuricauda sp. XS_ASV26]|uniref:M56 family metallopeptidase n=1 Tax=Allomuricauda sp. XS_ASV26 TaxID=3241292 RepID=UPI003514226B